MSFLDKVSIKPEPLAEGYPFDLPIIETFEHLNLNPKVTFFVGENGSGKSSLLEAIAVGMRCPTVGAADVTSDPMLADARRLASCLTFSRSHKSRQKMFFRAEDAIGFTRRLQTDMADLQNMADNYEESLTGYAKQLAMGVVLGQKNAHSERYGENPDAKSHGEWFLQLLNNRLHANGLYLLDEPETPLSPIHQLSLLSMIMRLSNQNCQFIIATHSPILMALPDATIFQFENTIRSVAWQDVEHVEITRAFLNDPQSFIRHL